MQVFAFNRVSNFDLERNVNGGEIMESVPYIRVNILWPALHVEKQAVLKRELSRCAGGGRSVNVDHVSAYT